MNGEKTPEQQLVELANREALKIISARREAQIFHLRQLDLLSSAESTLRTSPRSLV